MSRGKRRRAGGGRNVLWIVTAMLVGSGLIRLGDGTGLAIAREVESLTRAQQTDPGPAPLPQACAPEPGIGALLAAIQDRESRVAEQERRQDETARTLEIARQEIARQMAALERAEAGLQETLSLAETAAESDLGKLTAVYENMKPKDAAALFEEMDPEFAAGFLGRMRPDAAAQVMTGLAPKTAYTISVILAGRNADVPRE